MKRAVTASETLSFSPSMFFCFSLLFLIFLLRLHDQVFCTLFTGVCGILDWRKNEKKCGYYHIDLFPFVFVLDITILRFFSLIFLYPDSCVAFDSMQVFFFFFLALPKPKLSHCIVPVPS
ncbi:hypothetical protein AA313_de0207100 [Arthrobotrys entomopaga]|nr:hypothetical protein AA313_de0207100 [Arthrobotrys entomopaga]